MKEFRVLPVKCQLQTFEFLKTLKSEPLLEGVGYISQKPSQQGSRQKHKFPEKSLRQLFILIPLTFWHHWAQTLAFLCPDFGKEKVLPRELS